MAHKNHQIGLALLALGAAIVAPITATAGSPLSIHGSVSATASYSNRYNYLGKTADQLDLNIVELTLNGNHRFENGLRFGAQLYSFQLGDYEAIELDFASFDYSFSERLGLRAGRVKQAWGLYGESQDVDFIRPFAFLPLDHYPKDARATSAAFDGIAAYGTLDAARLGNFEYQVFGGYMLPFDPQNPYFLSLTEALPIKNDKQNGDTAAGAWLAWNTPLSGLKVGSSYTIYPNVTTVGPTKTAAELAGAPSDLRLLPRRLPTGAWDHLISGRPGSSRTDAIIASLFAEYSYQDVVFAAEVLNYDFDSILTLPVVGSSEVQRRVQKWYVSATWQAHSKLQLGTYYAESVGDRTDRSNRKSLITPDHRVQQKDLTFAVAVQPLNWWVVKLEAHFLNGTRILTQRENGDMLNWSPRWTYFVLKNTVSF